MTKLLTFFSSSEDIKQHAYGRQPPFVIIIIIIVTTIFIIIIINNIIIILEYNFSAGRMESNDEQRLIVSFKIFILVNLKKKKYC